MDFEPLRPELEEMIRQILAAPRLGAQPDRIHRETPSTINDAHFNTNSGHIYIGKDVMFGFGVELATGTHDFTKFGRDRLAYPREGRDIVIKEGASVMTRALILGPCIIGEHAVVAAGSIVTRDVPAYAKVAGNPARVIGYVERIPSRLEGRPLLSNAQPPAVFLLTIPRAAERRKAAVAQLDAEGVPYEIIVGVDGKDLPPLPQKVPGKLGNTHIGCYMTHLMACRRIVELDLPYAVLFEDDFRFLRHGELATVTDGLPADFDQVQLHQFRYGDGGELRVPERGEKFNRLLPCGVGTHGQIVSRKFAEYMLADHALPEHPYDVALCHISRDPSALFLELARPLVDAAGGPSLIDYPQITKAT